MSTDLVSGNIYVRQMVLAKDGDIIDGHGHNFDHTTYIPRGGARFDLLGETDEVLKTVVKRATDGYNFILIRAGVRHRITATEDNTLLHCVYAHRNPQGDIVQEYDGWTPAYV